MAYTKELKLLEAIRTVYVPAASAAVIEPGMFVKISSGAVTQAPAVADNSTTFGVANGKSANGETDKIPVVTEGFFRATVTSAAYEFGAGLKMTTDENGTLVADANADTIAWAWEYSASATKLKVYFNLMLLDGKVWDTCSA